MGLFLLTPISNPEALLKKAEEMFGKDFYPVRGSKSCLISWSGTVVELSNTLELSDGSIGTGVLTSIGTYYGRGPTDMWEWMKVRAER